MAYTYPFKGTDEQSKRAVFNKGKVVIQKGKTFDSAIWRYDKCGHVMKYSDHGDTNSKFGWEIDHIKPTAKGGSDSIDNLQPLYWENNRTKGDSYLWSCP